MRTRRWIRVLTLFAMAVAMYLVLLCNPDPLFAYSVREGTIVLHAPQPLPTSAQNIARDADARLARSPLYDAHGHHHVYLSDTALRFALVSNYKYRAGGVAYGALTANVFVRPANLERDRLIRANGTEVPGERTLTYFIAHEAVHAMLAAHLGRLRYLALPTWVNEGYADYIAKAGAFDYTRQLRRYRDGDPELDPTHSGLYLRHHLFVSYWLEQRGLSVDQLLALPADIAQLGSSPPRRPSR
jgi:hypothetical protein